MSLLRATIGKMVKEGLVMEIYQGSYAVTSDMKSVREKVYEVMAGRKPNGAVVMVNDR